MNLEIQKNSLSFRDPASKVYQILDNDGKIIKILRGVRQDALKNFTEISKQEFYKKFVSSEMIVKTEVNKKENFESKSIIKDGWDGVLEHDLIKFTSYPYEWSFSMLKDAALLHLFLLKKSIECSWILKDASAYNIQWKDGNPIFIDIPSFVPYEDKQGWLAYRQFCSMFLIPLLIKKNLNIDLNNILRSNLEGISPEEAYNYFQFYNKLKRGVFSHIFLPNILNKFLKKNNKKNRKNFKQNKSHILSLIESIYKQIKDLNYKKKSIWLGYDKKNSYDEENKIIKENFILDCLRDKHYECLWDIGCNNGHFSKLIKKKFTTVIAFDFDHEVIDDLYLSEKKNYNSNINPLVINFANPSPVQGWNNELKTLNQRSTPNFVLCLAFIHHARLVCNIPLDQIINWLSNLNSKIVIEFVDRNDEMVIQLLTNKIEKYEDYSKQNFIKILSKYFKTLRRQKLKNDKRELFFLEKINV